MKLSIFSILLIRLLKFKQKKKKNIIFLPSLRVNYEKIQYKMEIILINVKKIQI